MTVKVLTAIPAVATNLNMQAELKEEQLADISVYMTAASLACVPRACFCLQIMAASQVTRGHVTAARET